MMLKGNGGTPCISMILGGVALCRRLSRPTPRLMRRVSISRGVFPFIDALTGCRAFSATEK